MWQMHKGQEARFIVGAIGAVAGGALQPIFSLIYADIITGFFEPDADKLRSTSKDFLGWFFLLGGVAFVSVSIRVSQFTMIGETLTRDLRLGCFKASLRQSMAFYDNPKNSVGRLTTRLATDATLVKGATGDTIGSCLEGFACICTTLVIAFEASPELTGILLCVFPRLIAGSIYEFKNVSMQNKSSNKVLERSGEILSDAITAIRTVTAFNLQGSIMAIFDESLKLPLEAGKKRGGIQGIGAGSKQFVLMNTYALAFWVGGIFIQEGRLTFGELLRVFLAFTLASEGVGRITASAPDRAKAQAAARAIFHLIDDAEGGTPIDPLDRDKGLQPAEPAAVKAAISLRNVTFAYPSRPDLPVLKNFSLDIAEGETVALVGESGSGKSTVVQLVQRFYDVTTGEVLLDGQPLSSYNLPWLRQRMGIVSQEPSLFGDSVHYNIAYGVASPTKLPPNTGAPVQSTDSDEHDTLQQSLKGKKGESQELTKLPSHSDFAPPPAEVTAAARDANAHDFIDALQYKYATHCGARGSQLSGGQKQRVAIARSIIRSLSLSLSLSFFLSFSLSLSLSVGQKQRVNKARSIFRCLLARALSLSPCISLEGNLQ